MTLSRDSVVNLLLLIFLHFLVVEINHTTGFEKFDLVILLSIIITRNILRNRTDDMKVQNSIRSKWSSRTTKKWRRRQTDKDSVITASRMFKEMQETSVEHCK